MILYPCHCGRNFATDADLQKHRRDTHNNLSRVLASERPKNRGPFQCPHPGCEASFGNERNRDQHMRDKHGLTT